MKYRLDGLPGIRQEYGMQIHIRNSTIMINYKGRMDRRTKKVMYTVYGKEHLFGETSGNGA